MKRKNVLIVSFLLVSSQIFANMQTTGWRWINDDGDLDQATAMTQQDCQAITIDKIQTLRLRVRVDNPYGGADQNFSTTGLGYGDKETVYLQYEDNPLSPKYSTNTDFSINGSNECFLALGPMEYFDFASSEYVSDGSSTESKDVIFNSLNTGDKQLTWSPGVFMASSQTYTLPYASYTEIEYCITPTENVVDGTYYFLGGSSNMILHPGASKLETFPELTINRNTALAKTSLSKVNVWTGAGELQVSGLPQSSVEVSLYNLMGVKLESKATSDGSLVFSTNGLAKGIYVVEVQGSDGKLQKKVSVD